MDNGLHSSIDWRRILLSHEKMAKEAYTGCVMNKSPELAEIRKLGNSIISIKSEVNMIKIKIF
jgi:hypothetical protein